MFYQSLILGDIPYMANIINIPFGMPVHWHNEIEILYCIEGSFKAKINAVEYKVLTGQAIFVSSTETHEYFDQYPNTKVLLLEIGPSLVNQKFQELSDHDFIQPVLEIDTANNPDTFATSELYRLFHTIINELEAGMSVEAEWNIRGCLYSLSALIRRTLQFENKQHIQRMQSLSAMTKVYKAIDYVQENYHREITIDMMAKMYGYEKSNFCKQFKCATHVSFHKYLNTVRIHMACRLLTEITESISSIAEKVGFPEAKTFCRVFKDCVHMTPTEYRNALYSKH